MDDKKIATPIQVLKENEPVISIAAPEANSIFYRASQTKKDTQHDEEAPKDHTVIREPTPEESHCSSRLVNDKVTPTLSIQDSKHVMKQASPLPSEHASSVRKGKESMMELEKKDLTGNKDFTPRQSTLMSNSSK